MSWTYFASQIIFTSMKLRQRNSFRAEILLHMKFEIKSEMQSDDSLPFPIAVNPVFHQKVAPAGTTSQK